MCILETKKVSKSNFYKNKTLFKIGDIDVDKILISEKESYSTKKSIKYFIWYSDRDVIRPLCIKLSKLIGYVNVLILIKQCLLRSVMKNG